MQEYTCQHCGKPFAAAPSSKRVYCSTACHDQSRYKWYTCQACGMQYRLGQNGGTTYCSRECTAQGRRKDLDRVCPVCGAMFRAPTENSIRRYCSQKCHGQDLKGTHYGPAVTITCEQCGKVFTVAPSHAHNSTLNSPKRYCSRACKLAAARKPWPLEQTNLIVYACQECGKLWHDKPSLRHRKKYCSRACGGRARIRKLATESPTSIELATYQALDDLGIVYEVQYPIGRWVVDAFVPGINLVIECQGDFYHCNPDVYPGGPQYAVQRKTTARDQQRRAAFEARGYRVVQLWERDIRAVGPSH